MRFWALAVLAACGGVEVPDVPPETNAPSFAPTALRRLSRAEYLASLDAVFGLSMPDLALPADDRVGAFVSNVATPLTVAGVDQYSAAAKQVGRALRGDAETRLGCSPLTPPCVEAWVRETGRLAWRRTLTNTDVEELLALYAQGSEPARGFAMVVEALLQAPDFLYLLESGTEVKGRVVLDGPSIAARLAYFLTGAPPDGALLDAAEAGELNDVQGVEDEARRLLATRRAVDRVVDLHLAWLGVDRIEQVNHDTERFPLWDAELRAAMREEVGAFVRFVYTRSDGRISTLLSAPWAFPTGPLWKVYGLEPVEGSGPVGVPPEQRAGLLTLPGVQATHAHFGSTSVVHRGVLIYERLLCGTLGSPPDGTDLTPVVVGAEDPQDKRAIFAEHESNPACAACHKAIDPAGFAFEHYGPLGDYRTFAPEEGRAVDAGGTLATGTDIDGYVANGVELAQRLANSADVRRCVARQWYAAAVGRSDDARDEESIEALDQRFAASGGDLRVLLAALVTSDAFRMRQAVTP